jgi:hypothetical protein
MMEEDYETPRASREIMRENIESIWQDTVNKSNRYVEKICTSLNSKGMHS